MNETNANQRSPTKRTNEAAVRALRSVGLPSYCTGMGDQAGSTLQNYNSDLVHCIEELREKREDLNKSIAQDEEEKASALTWQSWNGHAALCADPC